MAVSMVGIENIKKSFVSLFDTAREYKSAYQLQPGETEVVGIITESEGRFYVMTATLSAENKILRVENQHPVDDFIEKQLTNLL